MKIGRKTLVFFGLAVLTVGGVILYKRNSKKLKEAEKREESELEDLGVNPQKLNEETAEIVKNSDEYGDIRRFSDLPYPQQLLRLLDTSVKWPEDELDWENPVYSDDGALNSVHVVFKDRSTDEYHGTDIGFFIEVPPLIGNNTLKYRDYRNYLNRLAQDFWAREKVECARPSSVEVVGLYSQTINVENSSGEKLNILQYVKIPDEVLIARSRYGERLDGLYNYFSDAKREAERGVYIVPEDMDDVHIFTGVWFRLEDPNRVYGGITLKQVLKFLEEMVLKDNYVIEDSNHSNQQKLGPVIVHPGTEFEYILDHDLKAKPVLYND